jgi:hypothetical protein
MEISIESGTNMMRSMTKDGGGEERFERVA